MKRFGALAFATALSLAAEPAPDLEIRAGARSVAVSPHGVLTGISGHELSTVDGRRVTLTRGFSEWFGVSHAAADGAGRVEFVGLGRSRDWARRSPVAPLHASVAGGSATALVRAGDLEVRTEFSFAPTLRYLVMRVTVTNRGNTTLKDVRYSREWRGAGIIGGTVAPGVRDLAPSPRDIARQLWWLDDLAPGGSSGLILAYESGEAHEASGSGRMTAAAGDVPLALWSSAEFPDGLPIGATNGISWGDYDADGHIDLFSFQSGHLWRNLGGAGWALAADLDAALPAAEWRYGSSFGDYDNDGLPDIATEPRIFVGDDKLHLMKNMGGAVFADVAGDTAIVDVQPWGDSETLGWADVDSDGYLDLFIPIYPAWTAGGPGNFFLHNQGPTGPDGACRFVEASAAAGLDNPPGTARPEGAQFADVDFDGDLDLFSSGTIHRNVSVRGAPSFVALSEQESGVGLHAALDEGAAFFDYDLDGDDDLVVAYVQHGVTIWENRGEGTFFEATGIVDDPFIGLNLGLSAEDWDNDGDVDFTTRQVFRRNMLMEEGSRHFAVAPHQIPDEHLTSATPAWGDWDADGDLDCALGNWSFEGHFYENVTHTTATPVQDRRHVSVRIVRDAPWLPRGLEVEYGAAAEIHLNDATDAIRRRKFTASGHGYLNQNQYSLHFALPADPLPADPNENLRFDVTVDFPGLPAEGVWRVDRHVNPALGGIDLAGLADRQIQVSRCGGAIVNGVAHPPIPLASPALHTAPARRAEAAAAKGGRAQSGLAQSAGSARAPAPASWIGLVFDTLAASGPLRIKEIILDGQLDPPVTCSEPFNIAVWDVTNAPDVTLVPGGRLTSATSARNNRSRIPADIVLAPGRRYRLVAKVSDIIVWSAESAPSEGPLTTGGHVAYDDGAPCSGTQVFLAEPDPRTAALSIRWVPVPANETLDPIGDGLAVQLQGGYPVLSWPDVGAAGYHVGRCSAAPGPCTPAAVAATAAQTWTDMQVTPDPGEVFWYQVSAVNACTFTTGIPAAAPAAAAAAPIRAAPVRFQRASWPSGAWGVAPAVRRDSRTLAAGRSRQPTSIQGAGSTPY